MITLIADENISHLDTYLNQHPIRLIRLSGRDIHQKSIRQFGADALFIRSVTPINQDSLADTLGQLKFIGSATIGTDHVDTQILKRHNIKFANAAGCSKHSVAQYVLSAIFYHKPESLHAPLKLGIIGLGNIGTTLAEYAKKLGWTVIGYDPFLPASNDNQKNLDSLMNADVISIHTPLTLSGRYPTHQMVNRYFLEKLNPKTMLINTARGEIIDENALLVDIKKNNRCVVLDVFPDEPTISESLLNAVHLATPHIAGYTLEGKLRGTDMIYQAFCQNFQLPILQNLDELLPQNPYQFSQIVSNLKRQSSLLSEYYDILADDTRLRQKNQRGIMGADFDLLRKQYPLRREWLNS